MDHITAARWRVPVVIAAVTALVVAIVWALRPSGGLAPAHASATATNASASDRTVGIGSTPPPKLHLRSGAEAANAPRAAAADKMAAPGGGPAYVLTGSLPSGPSTGAVVTLGVPTAEQVNALAAAFGLKAATLKDTEWIASDGKHVLTVSATAGGNWWYGIAPDCADGDVKTLGDCVVATGGGSAVAGSAVATAPDAAPAPRPSAVATAEVSASAGDGAGPAAGSGSADTPPVDTPVLDPTPAPTADDETVRRAAAPVLAGAGVSLTGAHIVIGDGSISVDPLVDGLPTTGLQTSLTVDVDGHVQWANGWLASLTDGSAYPLVTAQQAFQQLKDQPRMQMMIRCPAPAPADAPSDNGTNSVAGGAPAGGPATDGGPAIDVMPCGTPTPVSVTGATFGLSMQWLTGDEPVLAPSWLFTTAGNEDWPTAMVAIDPDFLAPPDAPQEKGAMTPLPADVASSTSPSVPTPSPSR